MSSDLKSTKLGLKLPTDPRWANMAEDQLEEILTDHAYCEQKAALTCISLISRFPDRVELVERLAPIVTEEWGHFRQVLAEMKKRGLKLGLPRKDEYVNQLLKIKRKGLSREESLMDRLLIAGLIEARSCERFRILSLNMQSAYMQQFYHNFMVSEAGHYKLFLELARTYVAPEKVQARWNELLKMEKAIIDSLDLRGDRVH